MIPNFIKLTFRNLWKNRSYSFLNIFGLAIGIACAGLIFLWVEDQLSYDQFLSKRDRLYYLPTNQTNQGKVRTFNSTPVLLAPAIVQEIPGIEKTCRLRSVKPVFTVGDKAIYESAVVPGERTDDGSEYQRSGNDADADQHGDARSEDDTRENVTPQFVCAKPVMR